MIILDSDVMIDILRQRSSAIAWLQSLGDEEIILPGFVAMELIQGCRDKTEQAKVEKTLAQCQIVWPSSEACAMALQLFTQRFNVSLSWLSNLRNRDAAAFVIYIFGKRSPRTAPSAAKISFPLNKK